MGFFFLKLISSSLGVVCSNLYIAILVQLLDTFIVMDTCTSAHYFPTRGSSSHTMKDQATKLQIPAHHTSTQASLAIHTYYTTYSSYHKSYQFNRQDY